MIILRKAKIINNQDFFSYDTDTSNQNQNQKPFIALHPLSSTISEVKSHFTGIGLASVNQYDDLWLHTQSTINNMMTHFFEIRLVKTSSNSLQPILYELLTKASSQVGKVHGFNNIPSTSSMIVNAAS